MDYIFDKFTEWIKNLLVNGIMNNLPGLFDNVNTKVQEISTQVGTTLQAWEKHTQCSKPLTTRSKVILMLRRDILSLPSFWNVLKPGKIIRKIRRTERL